jgi:hypothetical protein
MLMWPHSALGWGLRWRFDSSHPAAEDSSAGTVGYVAFIAILHGGAEMEVVPKQVVRVVFSRTA